MWAKGSAPEANKAEKFNSLSILVTNIIHLLRVAVSVHRKLLFNYKNAYE